MGEAWVQDAEEPGPLPKPSLQAQPSPLVPLKKPVTIRCLGPPGVDVYRLEKLRTGEYMDQAIHVIPAMRTDDAGRYRCSYQNGTLWSPPSEQLELIATGVFSKPSLSAQPSPAVSSGGDVTLQCQSQYGFDQFALHKEGDTGPYKGPERWYRADFPIVTVTAAHSGTYRCYSYSSGSPYLWSAPSNPLELVVTGTSVTSGRLPKKPPSSITEFPEASRKLNISLRNKVSTTKPSRNITVFPDGSGTPAGLAHQNYTKGNLVRICLGAVILILLVGLLAEDWHSRRKPPMRWVRAVHRPLPPLPQTQKSRGCQDGGRPDGQKHGCHHQNPKA
ncbi:PREDICTED: platelet glycoprotein VI [Ceratotherium simum simum]|uniref:Platelet glycoprotein VI n=1 Tax=Ceratotherium simum simum TaxID=73337 RepID=A0ABM1DD09_CERSS|nr:PREDICTED: platelet glycoprotein VI [Ceratotherium simum simum]